MSEICDKFKVDTGIDTNCQHVSRNVVKLFPNIVSKYTQNVLSGGSEKQPIDFSHSRIMVSSAKIKGHSDLKHDVRYCHE